MTSSVRRIVSGGQTGVDRAALDVALERGIPCGGWCPAGRMAEDGAIPAVYPLEETPAGEYAVRTEWNVRDSDGTLILTLGEPTGGTAFTIAMAGKHQRPCRIVDLATGEGGEGVAAWIAEYGIETLNVAGPRGSSHPEVYRRAHDFLCALFG